MEKSICNKEEPVNIIRNVFYKTRFFTDKRFLAKHAFLQNTCSVDNTLRCGT